MVLCIDTATSESGISLASTDKSLGYLPLEQMNASENIIKNIDQLLKESQMPVTSLNGVCVIKGPGSFTGLRVGISVANQFAHQLKIPIVGLTTDEWYKYRTDEKDFVYLQTMNRDEVYMVDYCHSRLRSGIQNLSEVINTNKPQKYLGQLSDTNKQKLLDWQEITKLLSPAETWQKVVGDLFDKLEYIRYNIIQPFYGKEPKITKLTIV